MKQNIEWQSLPDRDVLFKLFTYIKLLRHKAWSSHDWRFLGPVPFFLTDDWAPSYKLRIKMYSKSTTSSLYINEADPSTHIITHLHYITCFWGKKKIQSRIHTFFFTNWCKFNVINTKQIPSQDANNCPF